MKLLIRQLPASITEQDVKNFVSKGVTPLWKRFLPTKTRVDDIKILKITDAVRHTVEYHGVVAISPESAVTAAVRSLHAKRLKETSVAVDRYHNRSSYRDQRSSQIEPRELAISDRRIADRRRSGLLIEQVLVTGPSRSGEEAA